MTETTFRNFIRYFADNNFDNFKCGYTAGVVMSLILIFLIMLLAYLLKMRRRFREIPVYTEGGELHISAGAIVDLIKIVADKFNYISVSKVSIHKHGRNVGIKIKVKYDIKGRPLPELADELRVAILENLTSRLGIENVSYIHIKPVSVTGNIIN